MTETTHVVHAAEPAADLTPGLPGAIEKLAPWQQVGLLHQHRRKAVPPTILAPRLTLRGDRADLRALRAAEMTAWGDITVSPADRPIAPSGFSGDPGGKPRTPTGRRSLLIRLLLLVGLLVSILQTGCRNSAAQVGDLPALRLGGLNLAQPKEGVIELLGQPEVAATRLIMYQGDWKAHEIWSYRMASSGDRFVVVFRDAKVVEYGPLIGERALDLEGLFNEVNDSEVTVNPPEPAAPATSTGGE